MTKRTYDNERIRVFWDSEKCIHAENCLRNLPEVFNTDLRPWVNLNNAAAEVIKRVIDTCPSGALRCEWLGAGGELEICITILKNGPYQVKGRIRLFGPDGSPLETKECFALCRCGHSGNKPFCDGAHRHAGFSDDRQEQPPPILPEAASEWR
jgi:uncharacterized Fe-S cluster protein YjdI/CDGSH-type Zn-finger protein